MSQELRPLEIERKTAFAPRTKALSQDIGALHGPCVGCSKCAGLCHALIEALVLPDIILGERESA